MMISAEKLVEKAIEASERAYAPYSGFKVGAVVLTALGNCYAGCNVENASYGLTCCAERVALYSAVAAGERQFLAIALAAAGAEMIAPCGACRQVLAEFNPDMLVIMAGGQGAYRVSSIKALLPEAFNLKSVG